MTDAAALNQKVQEARTRLEPLYREVGRVIVGQRDLVDRLLIGLLTGGHILLEGVPGLAKTLAVRTLAQGLHLTFHRIQFTPDLLPADVIGTQIYNPRTGEFTIKKGPIFANLVLADEINRAPAKVQSALLEAMQEKQVTIGDTSYPLEQPFLVLATQNPIEQEGTYPLPEAQVDRFMLKLKLDLSRARTRSWRSSTAWPAIEPDLDVEPVLVRGGHLRAAPGASTASTSTTRSRATSSTSSTPRAGRPSTAWTSAPYIQYGASPRATIFLTRGARGQAFLDGRGYVTPQDVKAIGYDVLRHRVSVTYEAEAEEITSEHLLQRIFDHLKVP